MKRNKNSFHSHISWFAAGSFFGLILTSVLVYYQVFPLNLISKKPSTPPAPVKQVVAKAKAPRFDFYTMLEEKDTPAQSSKNFFIQVAAFPNQKDAQRLQTRLSENGFNNIQIKSFMKENKTWYRLIVGPYSSKSAAQTGRTKLKDIQMEGIILNNEVH